MEVIPETRSENGRDSRGRFTRGNAAARVHGRYSAALLRDAEAEIVARVEALAAEEGETSPVRLDLMRAYAEAAVLEAHAFRLVEQFGMQGRRGARVFAAYQRLADRKIRLARMLGLTARATAKPNDLAAQLAEYYAGGGAV